jgi:hypothetical protein
MRSAWLGFGSGRTASQPMTSGTPAMKPIDMTPKSSPR